jgi:hypothetical protein
MQLRPLKDLDLVPGAGVPVDPVDGLLRKGFDGKGCLMPSRSTMAILWIRCVFGSEMV